MARGWLSRRVGCPGLVKDLGRPTPRRGTPGASADENAPRCWSCRGERSVGPCLNALAADTRFIRGKIVPALFRPTSPRPNIGSLARRARLCASARRRILVRVRRAANTLAPTGSPPSPSAGRGPQVRSGPPYLGPGGWIIGRPPPFILWTLVWRAGRGQRAQIEAAPARVNDADYRSR